MQYKINWREHIQRMDEKQTTNKTKKKIINLKGDEIGLQEDHKRDGKMISGRKEQAKGPKP